MADIEGKGTRPSADKPTFRNEGAATRGAHFKTSTGEQGESQARPAGRNAAAGPVDSPRGTAKPVVPAAAGIPSARPVKPATGGSAAEPVKPAGGEPTGGEELRRVKKKKHRALKYVGIGCGSLLALVVVFVAIFAVWFGMLGSSMSIEDDAERQELEEELTPVNSASDPFYVLILGSDARESDSGSRSDVIMLARVDPSSGSVSLVSIPRDTMVTINGSTQKINAAYAHGGSAMAVRAVSEFAGVPISHFVSVHFEELEEIVDMLGGVWVDIPENISAGNGGMSFKAGNQLLTGEQALAYARERYNVSGGDFGRAQAQRQIVEAVIRQVLASSPVDLPGLIGQLANCITTDLSVTDIVGYAQEFLGKELTVYSAICPSYTLNQDGVSYVATMFNEWKRMMQLVDAGLDPNDATAEIPSEQADNADLGAASNSPAPRDYEGLAANAMTTDDVAAVE